MRLAFQAFVHGNRCIGIGAVHKVYHGASDASATTSLSIPRALRFRINPIKFEKHTPVNIPRIGIHPKNSEFWDHVRKKALPVSVFLWFSHSLISVTEDYILLHSRHELDYVSVLLYRVTGCPSISLEMFPGRKDYPDVAS